MASKLPRRKFLKGTAAAAAVAIVPSHVVAATPNSKDAARVAPSDKVNLACCGTGGRGGSVSGALGSNKLSNVVALCDVDTNRFGRTAKRFPKAEHFQDFRKMFDKLGNQFDAVSIAVPDHSHFPIAMLAMSSGKHIYVEKPLAHTFQECALMMAAQKKYGVQTQMGNQGHSGNNPLQFEAWVKAGIIKDVTRITAYMTNPRRWHGWKINGYPTGETKPESIDWDIWCGTAPVVPFSGKLHPGNWRSWFDYGDGAFGDWGPHTLDTCHRYLKLGMPSSIRAIKRDGPNDWIFPQASTIAFDFPAREGMPPCVITWYDGVKNLAPAPEFMGGGNTIRGCGKIIYGKDLTFKGGTHGATLRVIPESKHKEVAKSLPKITERHSNHFDNFILSCLGKETCRSSFDISGPLTQVFALGCIAQHVGGNLKFDAKTGKITNNRIANQLLAGNPPRKGWEQYYKM